MRILLTNDDGYEAPGIQALCQSLTDIGQVFMVAPDREKSATGHCITVHCPIRVEVKSPNWGATAAWAVDGTPSDCVKLGIQALMEQPPDLVVSGINRGPNLGTDVLYSGTVSAAMEGAIEGIPSIAFSLATYEEVPFEQAAERAKRLVADLAKQMSGGMLLNINIPHHEDTPANKCSLTKLGIRKYQNAFDRRQDPRGKAYYWLAGEVIDVNIEDAETDIATVKRGEISITPLHFDLTDFNYLNKPSIDLEALSKKLE